MIPSWKSPVLVVAALLGLGALGAGCGGDGAERASGASKASSDRPTVALATVEYDVSGMTCGGCALAAEAAVGRLDGVAEVEASYEEGVGYARVRYDSTRVDPARIAATIEEIGYTPTLRRGS